MQAAILSIGSELTTGQNLDTNSQWLSRRLTALGITVTHHVTVADDLPSNVEAVKHAAGLADLVIVTGGLGPTQDDLTREALRRAAGVDLVFDETAFAEICVLFESRGRTMPERNRLQAYLPVGAEPIANALGTAPGIWMKIDRAWVAALPGVPREMHPMFEDDVCGRLRRLGWLDGVAVVRRLHVFGAGESAIEERLLDLTERGRQPEVGITASDAVITLRMVARAATEAAARDLIAPTELLIRERLGSLVFGADDERLEDAVIRELAARKLTIATAESCTVGLVARRLGRIAGASAYLRGGIVAYSNTAKAKLLKVPEELLREHGAVSGPVVEAMAVGARAAFDCDIAVSSSGIAGPGGGTPEKPVGLVYIGLACSDGVRSVKVNWFGSREEIQSRAALSALDLVRRHLEERMKDE